MPKTTDQIIVDPQGQSMVVDIFDSYGVSITCYTASGGSSAFTLPVTISTATTFYLTSGGYYSVSAKSGGVEIAGVAGQRATVQATETVPVTVTPVIDTVEELAQSAASLPSPTTGDAGKVPEVNGTEDGYVLAAPSSGSTDPYLYVSASAGNHTSFGIDYMLPLVKDATDGNVPIVLITSDLLTAPAGGDVVVKAIAATENSGISLRAIRFADTTDVTLDSTTIVVWKTDGTQVLQLAGGFGAVHLTKANPLYIVDFRDLSPYAGATVGSDLTVDSGTGAIVSAAGGAFMCSVFVEPIIVSF